MDPFTTNHLTSTVFTLKSALVLIALGSNLGNRQKYLLNAKSAILEQREVELIYESILLENPAEIITNQPDFLNQLIVIQTKEMPLILLERLQSIEKKLGRIKRKRYSEREIDLDILCYEDYQIRTPMLTLPHPALIENPMRNYLQILINNATPIVQQLLEKNSLKYYSLELNKNC